MEAKSYNIHLFIFHYYAIFFYLNYKKGERNGLFALNFRYRLNIFVKYVTVRYHYFGCVSSSKGPFFYTVHHNTSDIENNKIMK
jgi:hypothetical protein